MKLKDVIESANTGLDAIQRAPIVNYDTGIKCLRIGDISQKNNFENWGFSKVNEENYKKFKLKKNDILIARTGNTIGVNIIIKKDLNSVYNNGLIRLRIKNKYNPVYIYYLIQSKKFNNYIKSICFGTSTQPNMKINDLLEFEIPNIELNKQSKIANILEKLDNKIELNNQTNDNLLDISQTIYDNYIKENSDLKYSKIMDLNPRLETGKRPSGGVNEINSGVPSIGAESIKGLGFFDYSKTKYISEEYFTKMKKGIVKGYEVLIYKDGGRPGYFTPNFSMFGEGFPYNKCALNEHVFLLDFNDIKFNVFAYYYFNSIETRNKLHVLGSKSAAIPGINQQDILNLEIPSVENKSINEIIDILMLNTKKILKNSYQNYTLAKLRDTLLPKLMNGEIDLDKIEI